MMASFEMCSSLNGGLGDLVWDRLGSCFGQADEILRETPIVKIPQG